MSIQIEWIKKGLEICAQDSNLTEEKKKELFMQLEIQYEAFSDSERQGILDIINEAFEGNNRIYLYSYFMRHMKADDFAKGALETILQQQNTFDFCTGSMLEIQLIDRITEYYVQKRLLHKQNVRNFEEKLQLDFQYEQFEKRNKKRIVVLTEQILNIRHAPTRMVLDMMYALQKQLGYEVMLFICPCDGFLSGNLWYKFFASRSFDSYRECAVRIKHRDTEFRGYQINMRPFNLKEYQMMFDIIHAWNPIFVFGISIVNPVVDLCAKFTTLVMRTSSIDCPVSEAQILLRVNKHSENLENVYKDALGMEQSQLFIEGKPPVLIEQSEKQFNRGELGLPENKFLIAIVGNRLDEEIDIEFVQLMQRIIQIEESAAFIIIGEVSGTKSYFSESVFQDRVFYLGYQEDLVGVYGVLDLYMNPKRMGGGYSSEMALAAGIPIITLPDCDVAVNIGEGLTVKDYQEMEETVCRYINDPSFYEEKKQYVQERMKENTDEKMVQYVQNMMNQIIEQIEKQG